jgi:hypothetical protein
MNSSADLSTILNRILDTAADNLRVAKILIQMGLDPNNITYDALFNRLLEIVLANTPLPICSPWSARSSLSLPC